MPLSRAAENSRKKAGMSLFPKAPNNSSAEFVSLFDPKNTGPKSLKNFEPELMQYLQAKPEPDTEGREQIKKNARQNVFGRFIGSLAQLGGVAAGGDATRLDDNYGPFALDRLREMDNNEAALLADHYDRIFRTDAINNQTTNQFRAAEAGREFTQEQQGRQFDFSDDQRGKAQAFQSGEARLRADDAIKQIQARGNEAMNEEMRKVGVIPGSKNAMEEFRSRKTQQFEYDMNKPYYAPRSIFNSGGYGSGTTDIEQDPNWVETFRKGREQEISVIKKEINSLNKEDYDYKNPKEPRLKALQERLKLYEQIKNDPKDQVVIDLYEKGKQPQDTSTSVLPREMQQQPYWQSPRATPEGQAVFPTPFGQTPPTAPTGGQQGRPDRNTIMASVGQQLEANAAKIVDFQNWDRPTRDLMEDLAIQAVQAGLFATEDEAINDIVRGANEYLAAQKKRK